MNRVPSAYTCEGAVLGSPSILGSLLCLGFFFLSCSFCLFSLFLKDQLSRRRTGNNLIVIEGTTRSWRLRIRKNGEENAESDVHSQRGTQPRACSLPCGREAVRCSSRKVPAQRTGYLAIQLAYYLSCLPCKGSLDARDTLDPTGHHWGSQTVGRKIEGAEDAEGADGAETGGCDGGGQAQHGRGKRRCY